MSKSAALRRSALYLPASNARALAKARTLDADVLILDLEDSVAPDLKADARAQAVAAAAEGGFRAPTLVLRVNGLDTPWGADDMAAAARAQVDAVLVPKIGTADAVRQARAALGAQGPALWAMVETCQALFHLEEMALAASAARLEAFVVGLNDLAKEMRARQTAERTAFLPALTMIVAAARLGGIAVLDGVCNEIEDKDLLRAHCEQGVMFGFDGKTLIHPAQIEVCNAVYTPSAEDVAQARDVIAAFALPENASLGVIRVNGKMTERLHLVQAEQLVAMADAIAARA